MKEADLIFIDTSDEQIEELSYLAELAADTCAQALEALGAPEDAIEAPVIILCPYEAPEGQDLFIWGSTITEGERPAIHIYNCNILNNMIMETILKHECAHYVLYCLEYPFRDGTPEHDELCRRIGTMNEREFREYIESILGEKEQ